MNGRRGTWRARLLLAAGASVVTLAVVGAIGEWAVRYRERHRARAPGTMSQLFYRHQRLMHGLVRGTDYYGWVHISRQGFRGAREVSLVPGDSVIRIVAMGGSTTFDGNVSADSNAWPARLEGALNDPAPGPRYEVLNAGVPGFEVFDNLVRLQSEVYRYHPAVVVLYHAHNNLFNALGRSVSAPRDADAFNPRPGEIPTVYPWERWLERHSLLYNKLASRWQAIRSGWTGSRELGQATETDFEARIDAGLDQFARHVGAFVAVARSMGIEVVIPQVVYAARARPAEGGDSTVAALWRRAIPFAPPEVVWNGYARFDSVARAAATEFGATYLSALDSTLWMLEMYTEGDPIHFNDRGASLFARRLAESLRAVALPAGGRAAQQPE